MLFVVGAFLCRWRRGDTAGGEGGPYAGYEQQQQQRLQRCLLPAEAERQQEVPADGDGWRQASQTRLLRHRRAGGALLRPQGGGQGHQRSHRAAAACAFLCCWRRGSPAGGEGGPSAGHQQQQQQRLQRRDLPREGARPQEVQAEGNDWRQEGQPRQLRHRRRGGAGACAAPVGHDRPPARAAAAASTAARHGSGSGLDLSVCSDTEKALRNWRLLLQALRAAQQGGAACVGTSCAPTASSADAARGRGKKRALPEQDDAQAPPQGAAGPSEASSYEEEDGFDPADIADAVALSLREPPPSASEQRAARWQARAAEQAARADAATTAAAQVAAEAAPPWDDEVEVEAEQESDSEEESEMEEEAAAAVAGVSAATAAEEEALECAICFDDLSAHPEARLQPRDPNGWGATRCCKSLFHYRCLHTWLSDDSEVETSHGMEPINTACPGCRGFVSKSASRMLS